MKINTVYLALGSNQGNRKKMLLEAQTLIKERIGEIISISETYETQAVGYVGADYLNSTLAVRTSISPYELLSISQEIEQEMGRLNKTQIDKTGKPVYQERCIDIDILYFENKIINSQNLTIPHPLLHQRFFVLKPLCDIAPNFIHPILKLSNQQLLDKLTH